MANNNSFLSFLMGAATGAALTLYFKSEKGKEVLDKLESKLAEGLASEEPATDSASTEEPAAETANEE